MLWLLVVGFVAIFIWYKFIKILSYWKDLGVPQTNPWPIVGDMWPGIFRKLSQAEFIDWIYNMYPNSRYVGYYQFMTPTLLPRDPDLIKQITVRDFEHFTDHRNFGDTESDPLWSRNLIALEGQKWREMRATLTGSFTGAKMKVIFNLMDDVAKNFVQHFLDKNEDIIDVELKDVFTRYTNDVIATSAFGIECNSLVEPDNEFYLMGKEATDFDSFKNVIKIFGFLLIPRVLKMFKISMFAKNVGRFFSKIINENIKSREEKGIVRPDMINLLLEARKGVKHDEKETVEAGFATVKEFTNMGKFKQYKNLTNADICSQALVFFFAGFETISTGMCFGSYELALNKEIQDKLRDEIKETNEKINGKLTYEVLSRMNYMDKVVSEILRKWPPAPAIDRVCTKPYIIEPVQPGEKPVPLEVGDVLMLPIHAIHRDPNHYPDPEKFDPERFSEENKSSIRPYTYLPFGSGPRNCIGSRFALLEIKSLFFNLLLNFEIVPTKKSQIPLTLNRKSFKHSAEGGFWFGLQRIKT